MLDIKYIREHSDKIKGGIRKKGVGADVDRLLAVDAEHRRTLKKLEGLRAELNSLSKEKAVEQAPNQRLRHGTGQARDVKNQIKELEPKERELSQELEKRLYELPNLPLPSVPEGKNERDNKVVSEVGEKPKFSFKPKDYLTLAEKLNIIDVERAAKASGTRFGYLKREAAMLEFALVRFAFDHLIDVEAIQEIIQKVNSDLPLHAFVPVIPPVLIKEKSMRGMGYMERGADEIYHLEKDNLYLVGTSEQSLGPLHQEETFDEKELPVRSVAFSTCFRREAGSYGKDTKGILRVHQFDKVEMFSFCRPEQSEEEHKLFLALQEHLMQELQLPYRVVAICTGDLGDPAAAKFDIEAWMPGQGEYRETHSTSNTTDFQARRLNIGFRDQGTGNRKLVHTVNGTAFAIGRTLIAIIENYQQEDGSVVVPDALHPYVNFDRITR